MNAWLSPDGRLRLGWRILLAVFLVLLINLLASMVAQGVAHDRARVEDVVDRVLTLVLLLGVFSAMLVVADQVRGSPLAAMGLGKPGAVRFTVLGVAVGAGMIALAVACIAINGQLGFSVSLNARTAELGALELVVLLTGSLAEELVFRGYPFQRLVEGLGGAGAVVLTSSLFGLAHLGNPHASFWAVSNTVAVGVLFSVAYLRTRSLWLPFGMHFGWNTALGLGFGLPVSGLNDFAVIVHGRAQGPVWLTGGAYGIEASAIGTAVVVVGFLPVLWITRRPPRREPLAAETWPGRDNSPDIPPAQRIQL